MQELDDLIPASLPGARPEYKYRFGDLISYQNDGEGSAADAPKTGERE
jgi:hypothetical protein